jgi:RHH-type rel operon transcriptional repressor/antitoxin RelB
MTKIYSHSVPLSIRIPEDMMEQLCELATATERTKSFLAAEAIENYLATQAWQIKGVKEAIAKADSSKAKWYSHEEMSQWLTSWGTSHEQEPLE